MMNHSPKKHVVFLALAMIIVTVACSLLFPSPQNESSIPTSTQITSQAQPSDFQPTQGNLQTPVGETDASPITFEIYEYKEGLTPGDHFVRQGDGWKPYHIKFTVVANNTVSGQPILNIGQYGIGNLGPNTPDANDPYILTTEGYTYGNTSETFDTFDFGFPDPVITNLFLFVGIPLSGNRSGRLGGGNVTYYEANFSVPEKLTPEKLVIPNLGYSVDLPPLGTENFSEISIQTDQIVNFPATVAVDPNIDIKVSNFVGGDTYITIDYEITNKNIAENEYGFRYVALVDSYGYMSRQEMMLESYSECRDIQMILEADVIYVGPGQSKTGVLCFKKNTDYHSSFYVLYFSHLGSAGPDNKAILIKP